MGTVLEGRDTYCLTALVPGRMVSGLELLAQRSYRRLSTPAGRLRGGEDEANFGRDLCAYVGSTDPAIVDAMLPSIVRNELLKDPEIDSVTVTAARSAVAGRVSWSLNVEIEATTGNVELVLAVSGVSLDLLGVR